MSAEDNKAMMRQAYQEIFEKRDMDAVEDFIAADCIEHDPAAGGRSGPEAVKYFVEVFSTAFPDFSVKVDDMIFEGDKGMTRLTFTGTHQGDFFGAPGSGRRFSVGGVDIFRFANGKIAEHWGYFEEMSMMRQLGLAPEE